MDVIKKDIKNIHLSVYPPTGRVRLAAPARMNLDTIRLFAISKLGWIRQQQKTLRGQERDTEREYLDRESHYVWGRRYLLRLVEEDAAPIVEFRHLKLVLRVRTGSDAQTRKVVVAESYRRMLKVASPPLIEAWELRLHVKVSGLFV